MANKYPPPWNLKGTGYIFLYKFSRSFIEKQSHLPGFLKGTFKGGFGALMLIDYKESDAGPYSELLFIPGKFDFCSKKFYSITKIFVSSKESMESGKKNWGIPKELAQFKITKKGRSEHVLVSADGKTIFDAVAKAGRIPFPIYAQCLPKMQLVQEREGKYLSTQMNFSGRAYLADLKSIKVNGEYFPDMADQKIIFGVKLSPLKLFVNAPREMHGTKK